MCQCGNLSLFFLKLHEKGYNSENMLKNLKKNLSTPDFRYTLGNGKFGIENLEIVYSFGIFFFLFFAYIRTK